MAAQEPSSDCLHAPARTPSNGTRIALTISGSLRTAELTTETLQAFVLAGSSANLYDAFYCVIAVKGSDGRTRTPACFDCTPI